MTYVPVINISSERSNMIFDSDYLHYNRVSVNGENIIVEFQI